LTECAIFTAHRILPVKTKFFYAVEKMQFLMSPLEDCDLK